MIYCSESTMRRRIPGLILVLGLLPLAASAQTPSARPAISAPKAPAKAAALSPEITKKLFDLGYPAVGENADLGVSQWRSRSGRKTIGALSQEEAVAIQAEAMPTAFGAYLGDPFRGYGFSIRQKSRAEAAAMALDECRKSGGPSCEPGKQIVFTGQRCIALAGYRDQVGADGKTYTAFSPFVGDTADIASATAVRNCASDPDGKAHCKPLLVHCADGSTSKAALTNAPAVPAPPAATPAVPPPPAPPTPSIAEIASKLFILGFPVSGKVTDDPIAAISQWRFRATGKPSREPLTREEIQSIMLAPRPTAYGAFAGATFSGFGLASQSASRGDAETEALTRCQQAKGPDCEKTAPMVVAGTRCIAYAGYTGALKADGKMHTLSASGLADDPTAATQTAMSRCAQDPDNAPHCKPLVAVCADGRQMLDVSVVPPNPAPPATPDAPAPPAVPVAPSVAPPAWPARPNAEVMNKLFALGYPVTGKPYDEPTIAIAEWRLQMQRTETGALTAVEAAAILDAPTPKMYSGFAGSALGIHGLAPRRDTRAKAEVDAVASCRQQRGDCDGDAYVVVDDRCLAFAGFTDESGAKPRTMIIARIGADPADASARAMAQCTSKPTDTALCQPLQVFCGDGRIP
jgi:hypothetical protein